MTSGAGDVRARIEAAAARAGRAPGDITLVAVTKGFTWPHVERIVLEAGLQDLGENRVQELVAKQADAEGTTLRWHMIGTLQRNKVDVVVGRVTMIHSVDALKLAEAIGARAHAGGMPQDVLLQVNTSEEPTKHGVAPAEAPALADAIAAVRDVRLRGLMTLAAPGGGDLARRSFALLRELRDRISGVHPAATELSMGMSEDLEEAVLEGATILRVGTAIFGPRPLDMTPRT